MPTDTKNRRVLIVDDDPGLREALQAVLELDGYEVILAHDGQDAIERIEQDIPTLILLDLMMPRMNGYELVAELERRRMRENLPIIVLTADANAKRKAEQVKAEGYITKPFEIDHVLTTVGRLLNAGDPDRSTSG